MEDYKKEKLREEQRKLAEIMQQATATAKELLAKKEKSKGPLNTEEEKIVEAETEEKKSPPIISKDIEDAKWKDLPKARTAEEIEDEIRVSMEVEKARKEYFWMRSNVKTWGKNMGLEEIEFEKQLDESEKAYRNIKNRTIKEFVEKGEKEKAQEFLIKEVELKRKNDIENKLVGKGERMKAGLSKGIEWWDNFGNEKGVKGYGKRFLKTGISLGLIGVTSVSLTGLPNATSYLTKKLLYGTVLSQIMATVPQKHRKWIGGVLVAGSVGFGAVTAFSGVGAIAGASVVAASALGYGFSNFTKRYDKKIKERAENAKSKINLDNIETDSAQIEKEIEEILKKAEKTRIYGKLLEAGAALAGSVAYLETSAHIHDLSTQETKHELAPSDTTTTQNPPTAPDSSQYYDASPHDSSNVLGTPPDSAHTSPDSLLNPQHATPDTTHTPQPTSPDANSPAPTPDAKIEHHVNPHAIVHQGGVTQSWAEQLKHDEQLAKDLGFKGDVHNRHDMAEFTKNLAIKTGYMDTQGHEVRVSAPDKIAYELKADHGHAVITEKTIEGNIIETHHEGDKFEFGDGKESNKYEYLESKNSVDPNYNSDAHSQTHINAEGQWIDESGKVIQYDSLANEMDSTRLQVDEHGHLLDSKGHILPSGKDELATEKGRNELESQAQDKEIINYSMNPLHLPNEVLEKVNETYEQNIKTIWPQDLDILKHLAPTAVQMTEHNLDDFSGMDRTIASYIQSLEETTGIHPRGYTIYQNPETCNDYVMRLMQIKASEGISLEATIDKDGITHIEESELELPLTKNNLWPQ